MEFVMHFVLTACLERADESTSPLTPTQAAARLEKANAEQEMQKTLLRLTFIMQQSTQYSIYPHMLLMN